MAPPLKNLRSPLLLLPLLLLSACVGFFVAFWHVSHHHLKLKNLAIRSEYPALEALPIPRPVDSIENLNSVEEDEADDSPPSAEGEAVRSDELRTALASLFPDRNTSSHPPRESVIFATFANSAFSPMLRNWISHVRSAGISGHVLVGALDRRTLKICRKEGVAGVHVRANLGLKDFRGSLKFRSMGVWKLKFLLELLELGYHVALSDTDTVWLANPMQFLDERTGPMAGADLVVTSDSVSLQNDFQSMSSPWPHSTDWYRLASPRALEAFGNAYEHSFNTGAMLARCTPPTLAFVHTWLNALLTNGASENWTSYLFDDQDAFNRLLFRKLYPPQIVELSPGRPAHNRMIWAFGQKLKLGILPPGQFCNGHVYYTQRSPQRNGMLVYMVHNTFQFYATAGKVARFRQSHQWTQDPLRYYQLGKFLSFTAELPESILGMGDPVKRYLAANEFYYASLRNALAVAWVLDRILILPHFTCLCDRYWEVTDEPCHFPGSDTDPPFERCPPDHLLQLDRWDASKFDYRESTFLEHQNVPDTIHASMVKVEVISRPQAGTDVSPEQILEYGTQRFSDC